MKKPNVDILPSTSWEAHSMVRPATLPISLGPGPPVGGWGGRQSRPGGPRTPWGPVLPVPPWRPVAPVKPGDPFSVPGGPGLPGPPWNPGWPGLPWMLENDDVIKWKHFRVTGPLCWEFTGHRWIPRTKGQWREALMFSLIFAWTNNWANNGGTGDLRRHCTRYDVSVMGHRCPKVILLLEGKPVTKSFHVISYQ